MMGMSSVYQVRSTVRVGEMSHIYRVRSSDWVCEMQFNGRMGGVMRSMVLVSRPR